VPNFGGPALLPAGTSEESKDRKIEDRKMACNKPAAKARILSMCGMGDFRPRWSLDSRLPGAGNFRRCVGRKIVSSSV